MNDTLAEVSLSEYLGTSYRPDCDYLEGALLERNVGEWDHARFQGLLLTKLVGLEKSLGILVVPEQRVQVKPRRFRIPDITILAATSNEEQIISRPPFLCIEILSPRDSFSEMQERVGDYLSFGVQYVWVIDPKRRRAFEYTPTSMREAKDGVLRTNNPDITINLSEIA